MNQRIDYGTEQTDEETKYKHSCVLWYKQSSPSLRSTSGVGGPWTRVLVTVLVTTQV